MPRYQRGLLDVYVRFSSSGDFHLYEAVRNASQTRATKSVILKVTQDV